jgi:hypothetical protein
MQLDTIPTTIMTARHTTLVRFVSSWSGTNAIKIDFTIGTQTDIRIRRAIRKTNEL